MELDTVETECRSLQTIRARWQPVSWPLDRIDGENDIIQYLYSLWDLTLYETPIKQAKNGQTIEQLIEDLEDFYRTALQAWDGFRTVFECKDSQRHFSRWPDGTYPARVRRAARWDFWEMVTTTRFNVRDIKTAGELIAVHFDPLSPLEKRHSVSLAIMVCIKDAIEALEQIEDAVNGENDEANLDEAWAAHEHASLWLTYLETLNVASSEKKRAVKRAQAEIEEKHKSNVSKTNQKNAQKLRTEPTAQQVADYFKVNPINKKTSPQKAGVLELMRLYGASKRTVNNRLTYLRKNDLM